MDPTRRLADPFAIQTDPRLYVPRRATEEALDELERAASSPRHAMLCLTGPPGIGKTLVLHVLAAELAPRFRTAYLPYPRLPAGGLWTWAANELALEPGDEPKQALRRFLRELAAEGHRLLLEIDDASSLPADTLDHLLAFTRAEPGLRVVLAFSDGERLAAPLPDDVPVVRLDRPMSRIETQDYVKGRLANAGAPRSVIDRFDTATVARLHRESEGIPLRVHGLAVAVMRAADAPAPVAETSAPRIESRAATLAPPLEPAEPPEPPLAPRSRRRARRRSRRSLGGLLWAAGGLCVGLAAGVVVGPWEEAGLRRWADLVGPEIQASEPASPAPAQPVAPRERPPPPELPAASSPQPEPAPAAAVAAAPRPSEPAPTEPPPSGGELASTGLPGEKAAAHEEPGAIAASAPPPAPPAEVSAPPPPEASAAPRPEPSAAPRGERPAVRSEAAPREVGPARPLEASAPFATGRLTVQAEHDVEIEIDGRRFGAPPLAGIRLRRGQHRVVAYYRDGGVGQKTVDLGDEDVSVTFR